jgi:transposase
MNPGHEEIEVNFEALSELVERARQGQPLGEADCQRLERAIRALRYLIEQIGDQDATLSRLRALLAKPSTEKTSQVLEQAGIKAHPQNHPLPRAKAPPKPGHGRNGAQAYRGAERIKIPHGSLKSGDHCPECLQGKVYLQKDPGLRIRVVGQAPIAATVYELERLRCNLCGEVYEAEAPPEVGEKKYDASAAAMIALLKYGSGVPWDRLERLEASLGIPLPASTQCEIVAEVAAGMRPAFEELIRQAAQGEVFYNDDTGMKILALARASPQRSEGDVEDPEPSRSEGSSSSRERTGLFTSGIVSTTRQGQSIALFFTGRNHAGENLARVFVERAKGLAPPIQMSDALSRNVPKPKALSQVEPMPEKLAILWANCNAHARRRFVQVTPNFPQECQFVLESLRDVYRYDAEAEERGLTPEERLRFHQEHSQPVMDALEAWFKAQFAEKKVEPNSGLGKAISYCLRRWGRLTLFLQQAGAPLDSNLVERALKKAILHRKNSLFYKTENGAEVGDLFMSLIHTCELNGVNPFDYLIELQKHAEELAKHPAAWMPWNYRPTLELAGESKDPT